MPVRAFPRVEPQVSQYPEYREVLVQHLIRHKLGHWERALRELASTAVLLLCPKIRSCSPRVSWSSSLSSAQTLA